MNTKNIENVLINLPSIESLAAKFDTAMMDHLQQAIVAKETDKKGPLVLRADFFRLFSEDEMELWPVVGSKKGDGSLVWDIEEGMKPNAEGTLVKSRTSWWNDFADASPKVKSLLVRKTAIEGKHGEFAGWGKDERKTEIGKINQAINVVRMNFRRAGQITAAVWKLESHCEHVGFEVQLEKDGSISSSTKPIKLWDDTKKGGSSDVVSVGSFLQYDPEVAAKNAKVAGDQFEELMKTATREKKETAPRSFELANFNEFDSAMAGVNTFLKNVQSDGKKRIQFLKDLNAAGTDDLLISLDDIRAELDKFLSTPAIEKRLTELVSDGATASA